MPSHFHTILALKMNSPPATPRPSSPTPESPPNTPMKSRTERNSEEALNAARMAGIHAFAAIMMEPRPIMPPHWKDKRV